MRRLAILPFLLAGFLCSAAGAERDQELAPFDPGILNHGWPETRDSKPVFAPVEHRPYFKNERAVYDYYPRFEPGPVCFDPRGRAYVRYGNIIQTVDDRGKWVYRDLLPAIRELVIGKLGYVRLRERDALGGDEPVIRFDQDGDAYAMAWIHAWLANGRAHYLGVLLHSRDGMATWTAYKLPWHFARFEKLDGHNADCLKRPPVIVLSAGFCPTENYILIPEKGADGSLTLPAAVKFAENATGVGGHSGDGNVAVTAGGKVFLVFATMRPLDAKPGEYVQKDQWTYVRADGAKALTPSYIRSYDVATGQLSAPVFLGDSGRTLDPHNWPALTIDSRGYLHALLNGHHDPMTYVVSAKPFSIDAWSKPEPVSAMTSYGSLNCDGDDTLYSVTRCSKRGYTFELALHRKRAGRAWEEEKFLVTPFRNYYHVWRHRVTLDVRTGRLFLSYFSQASQICLFRDEFEAFMFVWPDREKAFYDQKKGVVPPVGTARSDAKARKYTIFPTRPSEPCILVSEDKGESWRLAVTSDFLPGGESDRNKNSPDRPGLLFVE